MGSIGADRAGFISVRRQRPPQVITALPLFKHFLHSISSLLQQTLRTKLIQLLILLQKKLKTDPLNVKPAILWMTVDCLICLTLKHWKHLQKRQNNTRTSHDRWRDHEFWCFISGFASLLNTLPTHVEHCTLEMCCECVKPLFHATESADWCRLRTH